VIDISEYTGFPEIMDGRVKTLHPKVHGAILGRPDLPEDQEAIRKHREGVSIPEAIEQIDIGGPSMIRSSAKNHAYVAVVTRAEQYPLVLEALKGGRIKDELRRELAGAAFEMTARYDRAIADYMGSIQSGQSTTCRRCPAETGEPPEFPRSLTISVEKSTDLRYGENPHQRGAFYVEASRPPASLASAKVLHGKELSYNNLLDLDSALVLAREFATIRAGARSANHWRTHSTGRMREIR
jgi:phosphoribosylaminoimidazolecarboxamide formyltransferase/IMP cyclohydrolase